MAGFATGAAAAGNAWFERDAVADFEGRYGGADFGDGAGGFVAEYHGVFEDEAPDGAVGPVVDLGWGVSVGEDGKVERRVGERVEGGVEKRVGRRQGEGVVESEREEWRGDKHRCRRCRSS